MAAERSLWVVGLCPGSGLGRVVRVLLLLLWFAARGGALYFHIGETEKKCFIEEIPDETMVIGNYRTQLYDKQREEYQPATPGLGMFVEVKDPEDKVSRPRRVPHPPPRFALGRQIKQALVLPLIVSGCAKLVKKKKQKKNSWYYGKNLRFHSSQTLGCFSASCFFQFVADLSVTPPSQLLSLSYFSSL